MATVSTHAANAMTPAISTDLYWLERLFVRVISLYDTLQAMEGVRRKEEEKKKKKKAYSNKSQPADSRTQIDFSVPERIVGTRSLEAPGKHGLVG